MATDAPWKGKIQRTTIQAKLDIRSCVIYVLSHETVVVCHRNQWHRILLFEVFQPGFCHRPLVQMNELCSPTLTPTVVERYVFIVIAVTGKDRFCVSHWLLGKF